MQYTKTRLGAPASSARLERAWSASSIFTVASKSTFNPSSPHVGTVNTSMFLLLQHGVQLGTACDFGKSKKRARPRQSLLLRLSLSLARLARRHRRRVTHENILSSIHARASSHSRAETRPSPPLSRVPRPARGGRAVASSRRLPAAPASIARPRRRQRDAHRIASSLARATHAHSPPCVYRTPTTPPLDTCARTPPDTKTCRSPR